MAGSESGQASPSKQGSSKLPPPPKKAAEVELDRQIEIAKATNVETGLSKQQAQGLLAKWGLNELPEKKVNPILVFLSYFWGPMPIMIWVAIIVELVKAILTGEGWEDFGVLMFLQIANAVVGFSEEHNAGNAIAALKNALKPVCYVCRDGAWASMNAKELVPGDLILLKLGDIIPADAILLPGHGPLQVDQAALTGESLPATLHPWQHLKMGSAVKRGEAKAVVCDTGLNTFFGKAAGLIASVVTEGHLQKVLLKITASLLILSLVLCAVIFARLMTTEEDPRHIPEGGGHGKVMASLSVVVVILVASIPIAIEVVCTSTLAVGSHTMAAKKVIVARLSAIEELAGMTILCSDKTGTLTQNKLSLREPILLGDMPERDVVFYGALASKRDKGSQDAIDLCITLAVHPDDIKDLDKHKELHFEPFNPTDKRTVAQVETPDGQYVEVSKGAPHIILKMSHNAEAIKKKVQDSVQELADRGFRALGVGLNRAGKGKEPKWEYLGVLSLFDPPRHDTKATIAAAIENGIEVKMVTGDHTAIAKETCRELGMGTNILNTEVLNDENVPADVVDRIILEAHGFAEVMPEHKFMIVDRLRQQGHVTGMTGDGVNDAPALKRADIGIAVQGATDAARAAADLVLIEEGLSVIIDAIFLARCIFQRMRNYIIYRIACTIQLLCFFFFAALCVLPDDPFMYGKNFAGDEAHGANFTIPVISLVIITILNDGCMITISHDFVVPENKPQKWAMGEMTMIASILGFVACLSSLLLLAYGMHANAVHPGDAIGVIFGSHGRDYITWFELRTIIYLKISVSDFLTLFSARTHTWFWERAPGKLLGGAAFVATACSTLFALFWDRIFAGLPGAHMDGLRFSNGAVVGTWIYCIIWFLAQDVCKMVGIWAWERYFRSEEEAEVETFARRHSLELMEAAASAGAAGAHGGQSSIGKGSNQGSLARKNTVKDLLPMGVDLTQIARNAAEESLRLKSLAARRAEAQRGETGRLAEIAAGAGSRRELMSAKSMRIQVTASSAQGGAAPKASSPAREGVPAAAGGVVGMADREDGGGSSPDSARAEAGSFVTVFPGAGGEPLASARHVGADVEDIQIVESDGEGVFDEEHNHRQQRK